MKSRKYLSLSSISVCCLFSNGFTIPNKPISHSLTVFSTKENGNEFIHPLDNNDSVADSSSSFTSSTTFLSRRRVITQSVILTSLLATTITSNKVMAAEGVVDADPSSFDVNNFLKSGQVSMPMGVSGQAGKSRPETGVILRDGSDLSRTKSGDVLSEIIVESSSDGNPMAVAVTFTSPWPLATGTVYDVECRDSKTGDDVFLSVSPILPPSTTLSTLPTSFLLERLFSPTGRFSFYGPPTDIKVKKSTTTTINGSGDAEYRIIELGFSTLSQSTQTEIPRTAILVATIPAGSNQAVVLTASTSSSRWKKNGGEEMVKNVVNSFRATPAPKTNLKIRGKERGNSL
jgi:hypothetical protein